MKIKSLKLKNVKSFADEISIEFNNNINIFIGPNAGGKSNLLDIINIIIGNYFINPWSISVNNVNGQERIKIQNDRINIFGSDNKLLLDKNISLLNEAQIVTIVIENDQSDIDTYNKLKALKDKLLTFHKNNHLDPNETIFKRLDFNFSLSQIASLEYVIKNHNFDAETEIQAQYRHYLESYEFFLVLIDEYNDKTTNDSEKIEPLKPLKSYFTPYRVPNIQNLIVSLAGVNKFDLLKEHKGSNSKKINTIFQYASYYFGLKLRKANNDFNRFKKDDEVQSIDAAVKELGYDGFNLREIDPAKNTYEIILNKSNKELEISKASSGEKEILNFILGIFALNVKNGVVIIDEPELHLHTKWQRFLIRLFYNLSIKMNRNVQFFIVTHSPQFITPETIKNTFRVYSKDGASLISKPAQSQASDKSKVLRIVNSLNNEKIFFADKVVLVEGPVDLIYNQRFLELIQKDKKNNSIIEIVDIKGKYDVDIFRSFLNEFKIKNYFIADFDYLHQIGTSEIKSLFTRDNKKIKEALSGSKDADKLLDICRNICNKGHKNIQEEDLAEFKSLADHIIARTSRLSFDDLKQEEQNLVIDFINNQYANKTYILKKGSLDKYINKSGPDIKFASEDVENYKSINNIDPEFIEINNKILSD